MKKPRAINWAFNLVDALCGVVILALAVKGGSTIVEVASKEVRVGIAMVVVGVFASRLIDRLFN